MGFVVEADEPWIRAIIERHEWLKGRTDVGVGHWTADEWRDLEHLHQQHHRHQQQLQQQQHRQQQHQQRQEMFRYRQQQQQQQHQQYHLQQQQEIFRRQQHQQHYRQQQQQQQQQQHLQHYQLGTAKKTSEAQVEVRADREKAQAEISSAPPSSQTTLEPPSLSQLDKMENGMLQPPQEWEEKKRQLQALQLQQRSAPREPEAKSRDDRVASVAGYDTAHTREEQKNLPRRQQPIPRADESFLVLAQMRLPALTSDKMLVEAENVVVDGGALILDDELLIFVKGEQANGASAGAQQGDLQQLEQQSPALPPLLQQQQELLAPPPQEPWPPPMMAAEHGSGAGSSGESRLELGRKDTFGDGGCCGDDGGGLSGGNGFCEESGGGGDEESDTTDGGDWERAGIGTGRSYSSTYMGSGCEVAGRRLTRQRRARVREK